MIIPESVKSTWHEWRDSVKQAEHEAFGDEEISDHVEMVGWGVEEADAKNKRDASKSLLGQFLDKYYMLCG